MTAVVHQPRFATTFAQMYNRFVQGRHEVNALDSVPVAVSSVLRRMELCLEDTAKIPVTQCHPLVHQDW